MEPRVLFEDQYLLVLDKPPGLVVDPSSTQQTGTLADYLIEHFQIPIERAGIVHRLDKDTSGLIIVAKTEEALEDLQAQFKNREVKKEYLCLVHGFFEKERIVDAAIGRNRGNKEKFKIPLDRAGIVHRLDKDTSGVILVAKTELALVNLQAQFKSRQVKKEYLCLVHGFFEKERIVDAAIGRNRGNKEKFIVLSEEQGGKAAQTKFISKQHLKMNDSTLIKLFADFSKMQISKLSTAQYPLFTLLTALPFTGRTHQIRVHLKYLGFSIVGDSKYAGRKTVRLDHRWCQRQFLHATKISFKHPMTGKIMTLESPLPNDLDKALSYLDKMD